VVATGRATLPSPTTSARRGEPVEMTVRMLTLAEQLEHAGHLELGRSLA
jgi:hypothetical protein